MEKKVDYEMNVLRTFAIFLVVLLHINASNMMGIVDGSISAVPSAIMFFISVFTRIGVPLFVMISGRYLLSSLKNTKAKDFYKKRIPRLLLPLLAAIVIYFPIYLIGIPDASIMGYIKDIATGFAFNNLCIHMWYIYMILGLYLIAPYIYKVLEGKSHKNQIIIGVSLCVFGMVVEVIKNLTGTNIWVFWFLEFMGLFTLGYVLKDIKLKNKRWLFFGIAIAVEVISTMFSIILMLKGNNLGMIFHGGVVLNTQVTTIMIYLFFNSYTCKNNIGSKISKYALGVYLYHPIVAVTLVMGLKTGIALLDIAIGTVIAFGVPLIICMLLYKVKALRKFIS